jgi:hypothetical protein
VLLTSQRPRDGARLRVVRSPAGNLARPRAYPRDPYAGPFGLVEARGRVRRSGVRVDTRHVFRRETIAGRWDVRCRHLCARVRAFFPTWSAEVVAVLRNGERVHVDRTPVPVADVRHVVLGGYRLARLTAPSGATLVTVPVRGEPTNPTPGPSLAVQIRNRRSARVTALIEPLG